MIVIRRGWVALLIKQIKRLISGEKHNRPECPDKTEIQIATKKRISVYWVFWFGAVMVLALLFTFVNVHNVFSLFLPLIFSIVWKKELDITVDYLSKNISKDGWEKFTASWYSNGFNHPKIYGFIFSGENYDDINVVALKRNCRITFLIYVLCFAVVAVICS